MGAGARGQEGRSRPQGTPVPGGKGRRAPRRAQHLPSPSLTWGSLQAPSALHGPDPGARLLALRVALQSQGTVLQLVSLLPLGDPASLQEGAGRPGGPGWACTAPQGAESGRGLWCRWEDEWA